MSERKGLVPAMIGARCPQCREGKLFPVSILSFRKITEVNHYCDNCNANFQPEPDFFYGAMYISYAFSVALVIATFVAVGVLFTDPELWMYITPVVILNLFLFPAMIRYSKVVYLYLVGKLKYQGPKA